MPALLDDLEDFAHAIVNGAEVPLPIVPHYEAYPAAVALAVYRNNYRGNLYDALIGAYPVIGRLVGEAFFRRLARSYIAAHPSRSGNLHDYGESMAQFLGSFEPARELGYLADVAALEWACHRAYFAADTEPPDFAELAMLPPQRHVDLMLHLQPACHLLHSRYPVATIWRAHQPGMPDDFHIDLDSGPCHALVVRRNDVVDVLELSTVDAAWIKLLQSGMTLGSSAAVVLKRHGEFDLSAALTRLVVQGAMAGFSLETPL